MADPRLLVLLGIIGLGVVTIAVTLLVLAFELHATLRRIRAMARELQRLVHETCQTAWEGLEHVQGLTNRIQAFVNARLGSGARGGPRRRYRA